MKTEVMENEAPSESSEGDGQEVDDSFEEYLKRVRELREMVELIPPHPEERERLRRSLGLSRSELADFAGCAPATLKRLETEVGYMPRAVDAGVLAGLVLFYRSAGFDPQAELNDDSYSGR